MNKEFIIARPEEFAENSSDKEDKKLRPTRRGLATAAFAGLGVGAFLGGAIGYTASELSNNTKETTSDTDEIASFTYKAGTDPEGDYHGIESGLSYALQDTDVNPEDVTGIYAIGHSLEDHETYKFVAVNDGHGNIIIEIED